jgi:hypothetical protein
VKRVALLFFILFLGFTFLYAEETAPKIVLLISEQNIEGPQAAWWASEVDLSTTEAAIAQRMIEQGYQVMGPLELSSIVKQDKAFRVVDLAENESVKLGNLASSDYIVLGKAIASSGSNVPQSSMISCFANITVKLIRVKDNKVIAYLDASGNSAHMDVITGGKEALTKAAETLAVKIVNALNKEGGK